MIGKIFQSSAAVTPLKIRTVAISAWMLAMDVCIHSIADNDGLLPFAADNFHGMLHHQRLPSILY